EKRTTPRSVKAGTDFGQPTSRLWAVRNHNDKSTEILVLDASNRLHLVSKDQRVLWTTTIPGPVQGDLFQADLLKNGKLQYVFVASGQLYAIDRLGRNVAGFPKAVSMPDAMFTSLIDYDKSRNYRLLMANATGTIVVCDMTGKPLEGWTGKNLPRAFADAPTHFRISQRDYYEATTVQGDIFLFTRRAEIVDGFPLALNKNPSGDVVSDGKTLVLVSEDGTLVQVNTSGRKIYENALLKKTQKAMFKLVASVNDNNFVVVKRDEGFITGFDTAGKQLFEVNNPASDNLQFSLYHAGDRDVLVVFDKDQNLFYACDLNGKMLIPQPLQATGMPVVSYVPGSKTIIFNVPDQTRLITVSAAL
ncbi:MAG TPA: PQQ-binding-like beta-propeller repeat protein, partial [Cyclobacteriaceae bacterium]